MTADSTKPSAAKGAAKPRPLENVLVYSNAAWYRHTTLSATNHWFLHFALDNGINIDETADPEKLELDDLMRYQVLVLNSTTNFGQGLSEKQKSELVEWFRQGHGIVAVHAAAVHHSVWDWYARLVGCDFTADSDRTRARLVIDPAAADHPAVRPFAPEFWITEEWLCFDRPVTGQANVQVLMRLDESSFDPVRAKFKEMHVSPMGADHPAAWTREVEGGRFFYTAIGHDVRVLNSEFGRKHMLEALRWAAGAE
jgi:type 1 glutamine amidotransferase